MKKLIFIYDDRVIAAPPVSNIIGERRWGSILHKRRLLSEYVQSCLQLLPSSIEFRHIRSNENLNVAIADSIDGSITIYYHPSSVVPNIERFVQLLNKGLISNVDFLIGDSKLLGAYLLNADKLMSLIFDKRSLSSANMLCLKQDDICLDIEEYQNCLAFFSGGFESRYFNQIDADNHLIIKASKNKDKIKSEFNYYQLLPPSLQRWFVQPFDLIDEGERCSYRMERLYIPDMAIQWLHNSISLVDFDKFLDKVFYYLESRPVRKVSHEEFSLSVDSLYLKKLDQRFWELQQSPSFGLIDALVTNCMNGSGVQSLMDRYRQIYSRYQNTHRQKIMAIGHGDLCFSNMLYEKNSGMLRLIDPRGASRSEDLWMDPDYDIAKLSHSILGDYDWINNDAFAISLNSDSSLALTIGHSNYDLLPYKKMFIGKLEDCGYDVRRMRMLEASLFLSMLPLHVDNKRKVLAQIMRADSIIKELEIND